MSKAFRSVTPERPCEACGKPDWCARTPDGWLRCERCADVPAGMRVVKLTGAGAMFAPVSGDDKPRVLTRPKPRAAASATTSATDFKAMAERFAAALSTEQRQALARELSVYDAALLAINLGWTTRDELRAMGASGKGWQDNYPDGAFTFPERDGSGRIVGFSLRAPDGRKGFPSGKCGARRGLIIPATFAQRTGPGPFIVEGPSDVAAMETLGIAAVGRPSNSGGADDLAKLLRGRGAVVLGENDQKPDGNWPGRDGAEAVARRIATAWQVEVVWTLPLEGAKDVRAWLQSQVSAGLDLANSDACREAGMAFVNELPRGEQAAPEPKPSQAECLVRLALELYRIGRTELDEPFAVAHDGSNVALMFKGSKDALRSTLSKEYRRRTGRTPSASALTDAMTALQGEALDTPVEPVHLRVAEHDGGVVIDMGDANGRAIVVRPGSWEIVDISPVLFRRTALTAALPMPERGGNVALLRDVLNVSPETWRLVVGWLVSAFLPNIPHPILMMGGAQGTGKTTAARYMVRLIDDSPAPLRSEPRDPEAWAMAAAGSWAVAIDNVSSISAWWSDALCKTVTGDGWIRRKLYTDSELAVLSYRRVVALTSIDAGALRGDLGDRILLVDLERIDDNRRRTEAELDALYAERRPRILGAILDLLAGVLTTLPQVKLTVMPRMADFARVLAALDAVQGDDGDNSALNTYLAQRGRVAGDVVEGDEVALAVVRLVEQAGHLSGTAGELLGRLTPKGEKLPRGWPGKGQALTSRLKRLTPALAAVGVAIIIPRGRTKRGRIITIERTGESSSPLSPLSPSSPGPAGSSEKPFGDKDGPASCHPDRHQSCHPKTIPGASETRGGDKSDDSDISIPLLSGNDPPLGDDADLAAPELEPGREGGFV